MGAKSSLSAGRRYRRARRLRHDERAIVSVIGTLLAMLVFFALFGIFLTQYVPLWMTDNESQFAAQAATSFASFKSDVDVQYTLGGPQTFGTPFVISSDGVPLIAQPTQGSLVFLPNTCPGGFWSAGQHGASASNYGQPVNTAYCAFVNVTESIGPGGSGTYSQAIQTGTLEMVLPDRYYSPQTLVYEDDGVIQTQSSSYQIMAFPPPLNITAFAGNTTISDSILQQYGNASTAVGQGSEEVYSSLRYTQAVTDNGKLTGTTLTPFKFTFVIGTAYPCAWMPFLYKAVTSSGVAAANYALSTTFDGAATATLASTYSGTCGNANGATTVLSFSVSDVNYATLYQAGVQIGLGVGGA
ncbi:MAG: hypothetical protein WBF81_01445 [Thermoplasmata archaeon]